MDGFHKNAGLLGRLAMVLLLAVATSVGVAACTDLSTSTTHLGDTTTSPQVSTSVTEAVTTTEAGSKLSQESLDYALSLGGVSHKGEKLYFVIGASVETEKEALTLLDTAKAVGDMQSYFVVQLSDNFDGMTPGYWIVVEAYRDYPSQDNIDFDKRPFPDAYVKSATVLTDDAFPVYDDMVSGD